MNSLQKLSPVIFRNSWKYNVNKCERSIFSPATLGLDTFFQAQASFQKKDQTDPKLSKAKLEKSLLDNSDTIIFSNDIMRMVYYAKHKEDLDLVYKSLKKVKAQSVLKLPMYNFYIDVMKLHHVMNSPMEAMKLVKDPLLYSDFESPASFTIFLDLLFKNKLYNEIIEVYNHRSNHSQFCYRHNMHTIFFAACYKLNTKNSFQEALKIWQNFPSYNYQPGISTRLLMAALAVNVDQLFCAMEILPHWVVLEVSENLKCVILAKSNRFEDTFENLNKILNSDKNIVVLKEVLDTIEQLVNKSTPEHKKNFQSIKSNFITANKVKEESLESKLFEDIDSYSRNLKNLKPNISQIRALNQ